MPTPTATPTVAIPTPFDPAVYLIGGDWSCTTFAGSHLTHSFSRSDDLSQILVSSTFVLSSGKIVTLKESYRHHPGSSTWTATLADGAIVATAQAWTDDTWVFTGTSTEGHASTPFQMVFTTLGAHSFRRDFLHQTGGAWSTYAGETCRKNV